MKAVVLLLLLLSRPRRADRYLHRGAMKVRYYLPLVGYVVPTVAIGYGLVIPGSSIAGWNQFTVGFASAIVGAAVTYVVGVRLALRERAGNPGSGLLLAIARQARHPSGWFGRVTTRVMRWETIPENERALARLELQGDDRILEIGFGPGRTLEKLIRGLTRGFVAGVDPSELMVSAARKRLARHLEKGKSVVCRGEAARLPFPDGHFNKVFAVHVVYFLPDLSAALREMRRVLEPGGRLLLGFRPIENGQGAKDRFPAAVYRSYGNDEAAAAAAQAGFSHATVSEERIRGRGVLMWLEASR